MDRVELFGWSLIFLGILGFLYVIGGQTEALAALKGVAMGIAIILAAKGVVKRWQN